MRFPSNKLMTAICAALAITAAPALCMPARATGDKPAVPDTATSTQKKKCAEFLARPAPSEKDMKNASFNPFLAAITTLPKDHMPSIDEMKKFQKLSDEASEDLSAGRDWRSKADQAIAIMDNSLGPEHPLTVAMKGGLGMSLLEHGDYDDARPYILSLYDSIRRLDPGGPIAKAFHHQMFKTLVENNHCAAALDLPLPENDKTRARPQTPMFDLGAVQKTLKQIQALVEEGKFDDGVALARKLRGDVKAQLGDDNVFYEMGEVTLAFALYLAGNGDEAASMLDNATGALGGFSELSELNPIISLLILALLDQRRYDEANGLLTKAMEKHWTPGDQEGAQHFAMLLTGLNLQHRYHEVDRLVRDHALLIEGYGDDQIDRKADIGLQHSIALRETQRYQEALAALATAQSELESDAAKKKRGHSYAIALTQVERALTLVEMGRGADALREITPPLEMQRKYDPPGTGLLLRSERIHADILLETGQYRAAADMFHSICPKWGEKVPVTPFINQLDEMQACESAYALALRRLENGSENELAGAFEAAQLAQNSSAAHALASAGARMRAAGPGVAPLVANYEKAIARRDGLDSALAAAAGQPGAGQILRQLSKERAAADADAKRFAALIAKTDRAYSDYQSPKPVNIPDLKNLLGENEALVLILAHPGHRNALIFAVSQAGANWAESTANGNKIGDEVRRLRATLDPCGDEGDEAHCPKPHSGFFDRGTSYDLYRQLLGDDRIQAVIRAPKINTLLIVPSGALTTLPPAVLVTEQPAAGAGKDGSAEAMRATKWLIQDDAIAVLPTVSALYTLRSVMKNYQSEPTAGESRLFMMADPDFSGDPAAPSKPCLRRSVPPSQIDEFFRDTKARRAAVASLCRLLGTRVEATAMKRIFGAGDRDVLLDRDAREQRLREEAESGRLGRREIIAFATHGLVAGEKGLGEPALALAAPLDTPKEAKDDGLLTASEISELRLNANWIVLSACNTASPNAYSWGLSDLARAFFYAHARSLLATQWRVSDDVTPEMMQRIFASEATAQRPTKALALQAASKAMIKGDGFTDSTLKDSFAFPSSWAAFTLIGEPR